MGGGGEKGLAEIISWTEEDHVHVLRAKEKDIKKKMKKKKKAKG